MLPFVGLQHAVVQLHTSYIICQPSPPQAETNRVLPHTPLQALSPCPPLLPVAWDAVHVAMTP